MKYKVPKNIVDASKLLVSAIIDALGGSSDVGKKCGCSRQKIYNYEEYGYIPLKEVYSIAKALNVKVWHLSYAKLMEVHGLSTPNFEILVNTLNILSGEDKNKILKVYKKR